MKKKIIGLLLILLSWFAITTPKAMAKEKVTIYLFSRESCPHCQDLKAFLKDLKGNAEYKDLFEIRNFDVVKYSEYSNLFNEVAEHMGDEADGVPYFIIGDKSYSGYGSSSDDEIKNAIKDTYELEDFTSPIADIVGNDGELLYEDEKVSNSTIPIIILFAGVIIVGGAIFFARKDSDDYVASEVNLEEETKEEIKAEEPKQEEKEAKKVVKKPAPKKKTNQTKKKSKK